MRPKPTADPRMCKDCGEKYAQEMGLCRGCQKRRIPPPPDSGHSLASLTKAAERFGLLIEVIDRKVYRISTREGLTLLYAHSLISVAAYLAKATLSQAAR